MLAVTRFRLPAEEQYAVEQFRSDLESALGVLAAARGFLDGRIGRNADEPDLWVLVTTWADPGSYRRAISPVELRLSPVWRVAVDEAGAYEPVAPGTDLNTWATRSIG